MAATSNLQGYGTASTVTLTQTSLAAGSTRESAVVDNTTLKAFDYEAELLFTIITGGPATSTAMAVNAYVSGSVDGTLFPIIQLSSGAPKQTGAGDASIGALGSPPNLPLAGSMGLQSTTSSAERTFSLFIPSVAQAFGGTLPQKFSFLIEDQLGIALSASTASTAQLLRVTPVFTTSGN